MIIIRAHSHREKNRYLKGAYTGFGIPTDELKAIIIKGLPLMMNEVLWAAGMIAVIQCYSVRGLEVVAGLNIATSFGASIVSPVSFPFGVTNVCEPRCPLLK